MPTLTDPAGVIYRSSRPDSSHPDWIRCDGRAVSREEWPALFEVLGCIYGAGDGSTTFNVPDCADHEGPDQPIYLGTTLGRGPAYYFILGRDREVSIAEATS